MAIKRMSLVRGNDVTYNMVFATAAGAAYCLKNWSVFFTIKTNPSLPDAQASVQKIVTTFPDTTSGTSGSAQVTIAAADTANLDVGEYDYDVRVTTSAGKNYTVERGKLDLLYEVTASLGTAGTAA